MRAEVSTLEEAQNKLMQEVLKVHGLLCDLFDDIGNRFMEKYFPKPLDSLRVAPISDAPSLYEFALPFYASVPEADSPKMEVIKGEGPADITHL